MDLAEHFYLDSSHLCSFAPPTGRLQTNDWLLIRTGKKTAPFSLLITITSSRHGCKGHVAVWWLVPYSKKVNGSIPFCVCQVLQLLPTVQKHTDWGLGLCHHFITSHGLTIGVNVSVNIGVNMSYSFPQDPQKDWFILLLFEFLDSFLFSSHSCLMLNLQGRW